MPILARGLACSLIRNKNKSQKMNTVSVSSAVSVASESSSFLPGSYFNISKGFLGDDQHRSALGGASGAWLKHLDNPVGRNGRSLSIVAKIKKGQKHEYPWPDDIDPNWTSGHLSYLSHFKTLKEKQKLVTLDFEKPLIELEKKIIDVRKMSAETGLDFSDQISSLESKYQQAVMELYTHLTPIQRLSIARHPNRPTFLDHVLNITDKWVELHGDRAGYDDPAIVTGLGSIDGKTYMFIGHQKGRNTKENIHRNFGMPTPHGYRKALRMMRYADHHGFPIITFIDTPGAYADLRCEELGQGEAIAFNLREMFGLKVPIVSVVIGEGGSGGALAIGCSNKLYMLENAVFYVASPEACAAILWNSSQAAPEAAEKLKITSAELYKLQIADGIIPEPLGGAHADATWTSQQIKITVMTAVKELGEMGIDGLLDQRHAKFRKLGGFIEGQPVEPEKKRNMKQKEIDLSIATAHIETEIEKIKTAATEGKGKSSVPTISAETVEILRHEVDKEMTNAFISMGLREKLEAIKMDLSKSSSTPVQVLNPALKERVDRLVQEFNNHLSRPGSFMDLKQKLQMLSGVNKLVGQKDKIDKLRKEINEKLQDQVKAKMEILRSTRERFANGEQLDEDQIAEVERAKEALEESLKSVNLEVVGFGTRKTSVPGLEEELAKADELVQKEIDKAIDTAGLRWKVDELKALVTRGASVEEVEKLENEIREEIASVIDMNDLKAKVESAIRVPVKETAGAGISQ